MNASTSGNSISCYAPGSEGRAACFTTSIAVSDEVALLRGGGIKTRSNAARFSTDTARVQAENGDDGERGGEWVGAWGHGVSAGQWRRRSR